MRNIKGYWFLPLWLFGLLIGLFGACGQPGYTKYNNEEFGYTISYPMNWKVEVSADGTKCLLLHPTRRGSVMVDVADVMPVRVAINYFLMSLSQGTLSKEVNLIEDKSIGGPWDWYISYQYETDFDIFQGEAYFKVTDTHLYKLDTAARVGEYENYPFSTIISSFKLR